MNFSLEGDGWVSLLVDDIAVHFRTGTTAAGELAITSLWIEADDVNTDVLRTIRPSRLLALLAQRRVGGRTGGDAKTLADLATAFGAPGLDDDTTLGDLRRRARKAPKPPRRPKLGRPDGGDAFYRAVADAYRSAAYESGRPGVLLSEENDVPVETVRRWVKESRRRGFLSGSTKGRAY